MEHNLYAIIVVVEELHPTDLAENRVVVIVNHIMRGDRRKSVPFQSQDTAFQENIVFFGQKFVRTRQCTVFSVRRRGQLSSVENKDLQTRWNGWHGRKA